ncbi:hypothetical protein [Enterococcus mediterraneensis]|uniref:hypothetical protein n=1 Tax=Enterococcus mediterraneensis TaxID=2364791 RepID=UPI000F071947|nr:hypothetical protein [Enterococcus mediterraneensis]
MKSKDSHLGVYVAILLYGLIPRITINLHFFNSESRSSIVSMVTILMFVIAYQKTEKGKWERLDLGNMVLAAYVLCILFTIIQFLPTEFM